MAKEPTNYPSDAADKYVLRFPDGMRDRLKGLAAANNRTLNAEIVARLEQSFQQPSQDSGPMQAQALLDKLEARQMFLSIRKDLLESRIEGYGLRREMFGAEMNRALAGQSTPEGRARIAYLEEQMAARPNELQSMSLEAEKIGEALEDVRQQIAQVKDLLKQP